MTPMDADRAKEQSLLLAGFAEVDFTPAPGLTLLGQMHARRGERARDPLLVSAVALQWQEEIALLASADICVLPSEFVEATQALFSQQTGLPAGRLLLHATHTHVAPSVVSQLAAEADPAFVERLRHAVLAAAERALARLEPVAMFAGTGHLEQMGWNRRAMFADGSSKMYGHAGMPGFIGLEGPRDPSLDVLFARDRHGHVPGVVLSFSTHPNAIENDSVYSADIPGEVRRVLKQVLGPDVVVLYLTGAAGNTAPSILDPSLPQQPWRGEAGLVRSGLYLGGEAAKVFASAVVPMDAPVLRLEQMTLSLPIRSWPRPEDATYPEPLTSGGWQEARAYYERAAAEWPRRLAEESPVPVRLSVLRVGDAALCTNPAELFVEYGLAIRERSPARVTLISELTDGYVGYVPTERAFTRGGYETWIAPSSQLVPEAGEQIVRATRDLLEKAFAA
jgi:neutral ceramidase